MFCLSDYIYYSSKLFTAQAEQMGVFMKLVLNFESSVWMEANIQPGVYMGC